MVTTDTAIDIWSYYNLPYHAIFIPTNGEIKVNGKAVMGAGLALEAKKRMPDIDTILGTKLRSGGNNIYYLRDNVWSFPTKHEWKFKSDIKLVATSAHQLNLLAMDNPSIMFVLPRPGVGLGGLKWADVKKVLASLLTTNNVLVITNK